jgi:hypothetical protein
MIDKFDFIHSYNEAFEDEQDDFIFSEIINNYNEKKIEIIRTMEILYQGLLSTKKEFPKHEDLKRFEEKRNKVKKDLEMLKKYNSSGITSNYIFPYHPSTLNKKFIQRFNQIIYPFIKENFRNDNTYKILDEKIDLLFKDIYFDVYKADKTDEDDKLRTPKVTKDTKREKERQLNYLNELKKHLNVDDKYYEEHYNININKLLEEYSHFEILDKNKKSTK